MVVPPYGSWVMIRFFPEWFSMDNASPELYIQFYSDGSYKNQPWKVKWFFGVAERAEGLDIIGSGKKEGPHGK
jgi:hypothetical protein